MQDIFFALLGITKTTSKMAVLAKIEQELSSAPSLKAALTLAVVENRFVANYQAVTGKTDGHNKFQSELLAYLEVISEKPDLMALERFQHLKAVMKAGTTGLSFRDNKLYVMPGPNKTIKVQSSPAGKREQMEMMPTVKKVPEAQLVLEGDVFKWDKANDKILSHEVKTLEPTWDNIVAAYQRVYWKDGSYNDVVVLKSELVKARSKSRTKSEDSPWNTWTPDMCKKVATNRAYRLYHKYPDNVVTLGADEDKHTTVDSDFEVEPATTSTPEQQASSPTQAAEQKKHESDDFLNN